MMFLSGCETVPSSVACPSLPEYLQDTMNQAADEIDALPDGSVVGNILMPDYAKMRAGVRECIASRGKPK